ncbi:MAG: ferritin-like domain-containing protein [Ruminococcaceae bacterium]|nr:ferritin-like domain-containing protein [Oscillospiraceae bacterium]
MNSYSEIKYERVPRFRPPLMGCVAKDLTLCRMLTGVWADTLSSLKYSLDGSLLSLAADHAVSDLLYRDAAEELEQLRVLGELIMALGGEGLPEIRGGGRRRSRDSAELLLRAVSEKRRRIDLYETLMSRTGDRVVRSVLSGLITAERRMCARLDMSRSDVNGAEISENKCD